METDESRSLIIVEIPWNTDNHLPSNILQLANVSIHMMFAFILKPGHILGPIESMCF